MSSCPSRRARWPHRSLLPLPSFSSLGSIRSLPASALRGSAAAFRGSAATWLGVGALVAATAAAWIAAALLSAGPPAPATVDVAGRPAPACPDHPGSGSFCPLDANPHGAP